MKKSNVDDYIQEGIYGARQTKPDERKRYLGTLRERIVLALTKSQVMRNKGDRELEEAMKANPDTKLLLNGKIGYRFFKRYKKLASKHSIPYTSISNKKATTDLGAILTYDYAVDKKKIFLEEPADKRREKKQNKGSAFMSFFKGLFK